jgi:integrase
MRHNGHIRQRSKNSFEIRYSLGKDALTGKWKIKTTTFIGTRKEAEVELRRILRSIDTNQHIDPTKKTTGEFLEEWIKAMRSQISPKTHERYSEIVNNFLIPAFGKAQLAKLDAPTIQKTYSGWETSGRRDSREGGLAPRTRLHIHRILRSALKHAVRMRMIGFNPSDFVLPPRAKKAAIATLTIEQSAVLLRTLRDSNSCLYWPVLLGLTTGMRRGEIVALRWRNVDFDRKTVRVVESVEQVGQNLRFKAPKTEKKRAIVLPEHAVEELKAWKDKQALDLAELGVEANEDTFVCGRSWDGGVLKPDSLTGEFRTVIREIPSFPIVRFHDLRHSHATQLLERGIHPKIAQERLGHSSITTTLDLYSHVTDTMQSDAAEKLDSAFKAASRPKLNRPLQTPKLG